MSAVEWTDAEREALETIQYGSYRAADDARTTLARLVAAREAQAAAKALREAADDYRPGVVDRGYMARYLRDRACRVERIDRGES